MQHVHFPAQGRKGQRFPVVLPAPGSLFRVQHIQAAAAVFFPHAQEVFFIPDARRAAAQPSRPQGLANGPRQAFQGLGAVPAQVIDQAVMAHHGAAAALLHAFAGRGHHLEVRRRHAVDLVKAGFLEKIRHAPVHGRAGERAVRAHVHIITVRAVSLVFLPVPEIPQGAAVDAVHKFPVLLSVPAAPQPVIALDHKVHPRGPAVCPDGPQALCAVGVDHPDHHQEIVPHGLQNVGFIQKRDLFPGHFVVSFVLDAAQRHVILLVQPSPDAPGPNLHIYGGNPDPLLVPHIQGMGLRAGVQPIIPVFRLLRRFLAPGHLAPLVHFPGHVAHFKGHRLPFRALVFPHQRSIVQGVCGVVIHAIRENQQIRAHAHHLLGQHVLIQGKVLYGRLFPVIIQRVPVDPGQLPHGHHSLGVVQLPHNVPLVPAPQHGKPVAGHVPHGLEGAFPGLGPPVQAVKFFRPDPAPGNLIQFRI